jgi:phage terminase small subunit
MGSVELKKQGASVKRFNDRQLRFMFEYMVSGKGTEAAIAAGYSKKCAHVMACRLLKDPKVQAFIGKAQRERCEKLELSAEEVLKQLYFAATRDGKQLFNSKGVLVLNHRVVDGEVEGSTIHDLPEQITACVDGVKQRVKRYTKDDGTRVEEVETELKLVGKGGAIDMALKQMGMYAPTEITGQLRPLDWDSLIVRGQVVDAVEQRLIEEEGNNQ